jgi:hypothetical protein
MSDNQEEISSIEDISSEEDFDNIQFECPKCGYEYENFSNAEYSSCYQCLCMSCKECRIICDKCNAEHCWRCTNYFENCCKRLCRECSWFCNYDLDYYCNCKTSYQCNDCEETLWEKYITKRKNGNIYCDDCNINYCDNCDEYTDGYIICSDCTEEIDNIFNKKLPEELVKEIINYINF